MAQIIPIRDLKDTTSISERCRTSREPIFVTKNGYGDMVLMSMDVYNAMFAEIRLFRDLKESEDEIKSGKGLSFEEFSAKVREKVEEYLTTVHEQIKE